MRNGLGAALLLAALLAASPAGAQTEPADSTIKGAVYDIGRAEGELPTLTPDRKPNILRLQRSMKMTEQRLNGSPNKSHPSWLEAKARLDKVNQALADLAQGGGASAASATRPAAQPTPQDAPPAAAAPVPQAALATSSPAVAPLVSGERVRVKKLARDMESAMDSINKGGVRPFQDPDYVAKWEQSLERFQAALGRYPQVDDPDVRAAAAKRDELENLIAFGKGEAGKQFAELGDVQAILKAAEGALRGHRAPQTLLPPFSREQAKAWLDAGQTARETAQKVYAELQRITPLAYLPRNVGTVQEGAPYDDQDLDRLARFAQETAAEVDAARRQTAENLKLQFSTQDSELAYFRKLDPDDENDRSNAFLAEGAEERIYGDLDRHLALARTVVDYQVANGQEPAPATVARVEEVTALRAAYAANRTKAIGDSRLPEPKSTDSSRIAIAKEILGKPGYEFGRHGPVVLTTAEIVDREKTVSRAEVSDVDVSLSGTITLSGTQETWNYKWKEFKFATPIKEADSDDWYIWWITAKNYASGWERTPIGVWVAGGSVKGSRILPENF